MTPLIGIANSPYVMPLITQFPGLVDYIEIPFEQLQYDPSVIQLRKLIPVILHSASLSIAGTVPPGQETIDSVVFWAKETHTPWVGEHLAFLKADRFDNEASISTAAGPPYETNYSISPQMSLPSVNNVVKALENLQAYFEVPLLLENLPIYFSMPGSTMNQVEFINEICHRSNVHLLLDLTHFFIAARNLNFDPKLAISKLPLDRVVEIHVSGVSKQSGVYWDDHAVAAPEPIFELLSIVLRQSRPRAITLEYNWSSRFPFSVIEQQVVRLRSLVSSNLARDQ